MPVTVAIIGNKNGFKNLLPLFKNSRLRLAGSYKTGEEALRKRWRKIPDVVLVDFNLPCMDGFECVRKLTAQMPKLPVLMFVGGHPTRSEDDGFIFAALHAGANGYLPGHLPSVDLAGAILRVHSDARRSRHPFLMFFESDRRLKWSARYWDRIAAILNAATVLVSYENNWRKVVLHKRAARGFSHPVTPDTLFGETNKSVYISDDKTNRMNSRKIKSDHCYEMHH